MSPAISTRKKESVLDKIAKVVDSSLKTMNEVYSQNFTPASLGKQAGDYSGGGGIYKILDNFDSTRVGAYSTRFQRKGAMYLLSITSMILGFIFLSPRIIGSVIGELSFSVSSIIGVVLIFLGLLLFFVGKNAKRK